MAREDIIMLSQKELKRLHVIQKALEGVLKQVEAADMLSIKRSSDKETHKKGKS